MRGKAIAKITKSHVYNVWAERKANYVERNVTTVTTKAGWKRK